MDQLEKVEKLREKTGVSYEDAKNALEACEYDVLDALIYLEKLGKIEQPKVSQYTTGQEMLPSQEFARTQENYQNSCQSKGVGDVFDRFFKWCGRVIKKGCETTFEVTRHGKVMVSVPVLVFVLCMLFAFWITIPLLIVGMFCDCKYKFLGFESTSVDINEFCDKASETCESIKNDWQGRE